MKIRLVIILAIIGVFGHAQIPSKPLQIEIPSLEVLTPPDSIIERHRWLHTARICLKSVDGDTILCADSVSIRGRGNSTWSKRKKPYVFRLGRKRSVIGMAPHREWVLLANVMDHSLMRNDLAFEIARQTSLDWTPQGRFVRLSHNGKYGGLYYLCESVDISSSRLNGDSCAVLIKFDSYEPHGIKITLSDGSHPHNWVDVVRPRSLKLDTLSLVDWIITNELTMNAEPFGPRSCYMHVSPQGVLKAGPVWDFDLAFNNVGISPDNNLRPYRFRGHMDSVKWLDTQSSFCLDSPYLDNLKRFGFAVPATGELRSLIAVRWQQLRPKMYGLLLYLDQVAKLINADTLEDQALWLDADPARFDSAPDHGESVKALRNTFVSRLEYMDRLCRHQ